MSLLDNYIGEENLMEHTTSLPSKLQIEQNTCKTSGEKWQWLSWSQSKNQRTLSV